MFKARLSLISHNLYLIILLSAFLCAACGSRPLLYSYQTVNEEGWMCTDTVRFAVDGLSAAGTYDLRVGVRCNNLYAYQNLWLVVERRTASAPNHRDTLQLQLIDEASGELTASNILHTQEQTVGTFSVRQPQQPIELLVYHVMEEQLLKGVTEVGVSLTFHPVGE